MPCARGRFFAHEACAGDYWGDAVRNDHKIRVGSHSSGQLAHRLAARLSAVTRFPTSRRPDAPVVKVALNPVPSDEIEASLAELRIPEGPPAPPPDVPIDALCHTLASAAQAHGIPTGFFARLIWQESKFQQRVVSHAGAQGVAQFMPAVAAERGLRNPFDPLDAIPHSARFLKEHLDYFGNLGLAAAAYNGGARRVTDWLARRGKLPQETRHYVKTITGHDPERWTEENQIELAVNLPSRAPCEGVGRSVARCRARQDRGPARTAGRKDRRERRGSRRPRRQRPQRRGSRQPRRRRGKRCSPRARRQGQSRQSGGQGCDASRQPATARQAETAGQDRRPRADQLARGKARQGQTGRDQRRQALTARAKSGVRRLHIPDRLRRNRAIGIAP